MTDATYKSYQAFSRWLKRNSFNLKIALIALLAMGALAGVAGGLIWLKAWGLSDGGEADFGGGPFAGSVSVPKTYDKPLLIKLTDLALSIAPVGANAAQAEARGNVIKYFDAFANTDIVQTRYSNKIKEDIILKKPGHPAIFEYRLDLASYDFKKNEQGDLIFYQKGHAGEDAYLRFVIPAPFLIDADGKKSSASEVDFELSVDGRLTLKPDSAWLTRAKYPVTLDPTIEISVLNVHSHPQQGQNWTVDFITQGKADLKIIPNDQATIDDDEYVSLACNGQKRHPQILAGDVISYSGWQCDGTATVIHYTKKAGNHVLRFEFASQIAFAYNSSSGSSIVFRGGSSTVFRGGSTAASDTNPAYVENVFSTDVYTGNDSTQTIVNGINLALSGGMVWLKSRASASDTHTVADTVRGRYSYLYTTTIATADTPTAAYGVTFNSNGYTINGNWNGENRATNATVGWTFREAPGFFDIVTYTGDGNTGRAISHSLGGNPGMIVIKRITANSALGTFEWAVWHRSLTAGYHLLLNQNNVEASGDWITSVTSSSFTVSDRDDVNRNNETYIAYIFAHDTDADGLIQCGTYDGTEAVQNISLGWEPQFIIVKRKSGGTGQWGMIDSMRNMSVVSATFLYANLADADSSGSPASIYPSATGFTVSSGATWNTVDYTYVYCAIRRGPMKQPTSGAQVFSAVSRSGTGAAATITGVGFPPDAVLIHHRDAPVNTHDDNMSDRLRGTGVILLPDTAGAEYANAQLVTSFNMDGFSLGTYGDLNASDHTFMNYAFRRAPSVFDTVAYTGTNQTTDTVYHSLGVAPELIIWKQRSPNTQNWRIWAKPHSYLAGTYGDDYCMLTLNSNGTNEYAESQDLASLPTATSIVIPNGSDMSSNASLYIAYLFATKAGVSKVGSYTGNGTSQTINAGFAAGAGFIMIKRTDAGSTGDWIVWDSTRGIIAGNDPHIALNTTDAEVTNNDSVDPDNSGFIVNQVAATNVNVENATYIYLTFASPPAAASNPSVIFRIPAP